MDQPIVQVVDDEDDDDGEDTVEDDMVEVSRKHAQQKASQSCNHSMRGDQVSQRMEMQSRIKDQVLANNAEGAD